MPTPGPDIGTPFGPDNMFVLHTVQTGESLSSIAAAFQTTIDVIRASNVLIEGASVWPGTILVLIPGETSPEEVGKYVAIWVEANTNISELSDEYGVDAEEIRDLNNLGPIADIVPGGRWIILPVSK